MRAYLAALVAALALSVGLTSTPAEAQTATAPPPTAAVPAEAAIDAAQLEALGERVAEFEAAIRASDFDGVLAVVPPRVLDVLATRFGVTPDQMRSVFRVQAAQTMRQVEIVSFTMDVEDARPGEVPAGVPYVLIPTETVMVEETLGRAVARSRTIALLDGGAWYLVRVDDDRQISVLREAYPGFADVEFEPHTLDFVDG